jgi:hypothetical protein
MAAGKSEVVSVQVEPQTEIGQAAAEAWKIRGLADLAQPMAKAYCRGTRHATVCVSARALPHATHPKQGIAPYCLN